MSFRRKLICAIVPGACVLAFALAARAEDYKVVLNRPETVGQTYSTTPVAR